MTDLPSSQRYVYDGSVAADMVVVAIAAESAAGVWIADGAETFLHIPITAKMTSTIPITVQKRLSNELIGLEHPERSAEESDVLHEIDLIGHFRGRIRILPKIMHEYGRRHEENDEEK